MVCGVKTPQEMHIYFYTFQTLWSLNKRSQSVFTIMAIKKPLFHFRQGCWGTGNLAKSSWPSAHTAAIPGCTLVNFHLCTSSPANLCSNHCAISATTRFPIIIWTSKAHSSCLLLIWSPTTLHTSTVPVIMSQSLSPISSPESQHRETLSMHQYLMAGWIHYISVIKQGLTYSGQSPVK